jgi:hypothetical protein
MSSGNVAKRRSKANPLLVQPFVCGQSPVIKDAREGEQTGWVT